MDLHFDQSVDASDIRTIVQELKDKPDGTDVVRDSRGRRDPRPQGRRQATLEVRKHDHPDEIVTLRLPWRIVDAVSTADRDLDVDALARAAPARRARRPRGDQRARRAREDLDRLIRRAKDQKVTLRRILTHTAGTSGHGFPGYAVDAPRPTLVQLLKGEKPANTAPVVVTVIPGSEWRYSGGGVCIEQLLMTDVTGQPFPEILRERLFDRIGMTSSTYEQPLPPARAALAASGTYADGREVPGRWHVYPEMAAAGLWTTPTDLAKFAIEIALSAQGRANHALSQGMAREMLFPQFPRVSEPTWGDKRNPDRMGLGFFLGDSLRPERFGHIGDDEGFAAVLILFGDTGQGAVIMVNSELGIVLANLVLASIAKEYDWRYTPPRYPMLVMLLYVFLAVPLALVLACALGLFYALSPAPRAWISYVLACLMTVYAHAVAALLGFWPDWMVHPLRGPRVESTRLLVFERVPAHLRDDLVEPVLARAEDEAHLPVLAHDVLDLHGELRRQDAVEVHDDDALLGVEERAPLGLPLDDLRDDPVRDRHDPEDVEVGDREPEEAVLEAQGLEVAAERHRDPLLDAHRRGRAGRPRAR